MTHTHERLSNAKYGKWYESGATRAELFDAWRESERSEFCDIVVVESGKYFRITPLHGVRRRKWVKYAVVAVVIVGCML